ncbi:transcriptional activator of glycolytic enzymes domain-containing protein [Hirsutella rhossiliensis]|uniref:Transcriptional activator of glycolytic enzymes domain-containing protein n=1 Tax=Hirsutella rhossiliensis TaxID=111463 RepID=A0A9P8SQ21_9HYPO|nr:transcriptional activator of glycolytic enzymes domain-containing protein [Hirsutella rhossiliensis]KAH0968781.1 transcriptional activator of glycolytic enzymes domain-containing protein [Hirsutella rhossiliensis]
MSKTSAMATTKRTILTEPQDWDRWVKELRARVDKLVHKLVFEDGSEPMELPIRPTFDDFGEGSLRDEGIYWDTFTEPCQEIWIDWTELTPDFEGYVRVMFITDAYSGMVFPYFLKTYQSKHHLAALRDFVSWMKLRFDYTVKIVRSDGELFTNKIKNGEIGLEHTGPERARKMRIVAGLPHDLWKETVEASCYLRNRTPRAPRATNSTPNSSEDWKTPLELFTKKDRPQQHAQLKAYGCRAYAMTSNAQLGKKKRQKLDPRSHIGYLVGYNSTNIFRIWIPQRRKVISTRDVIFDEFTYFDGKFEQPPLLPTINELIQRVEIPEDQKINQEILGEESELESVFDEDSEVWPQLDKWKEAHSSPFLDLGVEQNMAAGAFLELLEWLREVLLQDAVFFRESYPDHPIFQDPVFSCPEFEAFASKVHTCTRDHEDSHTQSFKKRSPEQLAERRHLDLLGASYELCTKLHEFAQATYTVTFSPGQSAAGQRAEVAGAHQERRRAPREAVLGSEIDPSQAVGPTYAPLPLEQQQEMVFKLPRSVKSVQELLRLWRQGWGEMPSVDSLERDWGSRWRPSAEKNYFSTRKIIVDEVRRRVQLGGLTEDIVARQMDEERGPSSLDKLFKAIRKGRQGERGTQTYVEAS